MAALLGIGVTPSALAAGKMNRQQPNSQAAIANTPTADWVSYLHSLQRYVSQQPSVAAEQALENAGKAQVSAQQGNIGLNLNLSYNDYPQGAGTSAGGGFTDLRQYGEGRLSWGLIDFFARRPGLIDNAKATENQYHFDAKSAEIQTEQSLIADEVAAWAASAARKALKQGLARATDAKAKLGLAAKASMANITHATPERVTQALTLYSQIRSALAALPEAIPNAPRVPTDFSVLPLETPRFGTVRKIANDAPQAASYRAQSSAASGEARSYWGNGVHLDVFGGYITEKRQGSGGFKSGPEVGATLTVPIGSTDHDKAKAAEWRAKAESLNAQAAILDLQRQLYQLRQQWASDVANMEAAEAAMLRQATLLSKMKIRARYPQSGQAPEPWQLDMQAAQFWLSVGEVWDKRRQWVQDTLIWAIYDPSNPNAVHSLCAPLSSCEQG